MRRFRIESHPAYPGPWPYDWRCRLCSQGVYDHIGALRWRWRQWMAGLRCGLAKLR